jgi:hypothetical protein
LLWRIVITGTVPGACYAQGLTAFLTRKHIRIFDYARFAKPLRERIRAKAQELAAQHNVRIEHIAKVHIRKEDMVAKVLARRGDHPGLVHVISAMEACFSYEPWHDKKTQAFGVFTFAISAWKRQKERPHLFLSYRS